MRCLKAGRNCSPQIAGAFGPCSGFAGEHLADHTGVASRGVPGLLDARMPQALFTLQSPGHEEVAAPGILHLHGDAAAARIFHVDPDSIAKVLATKIFHLNRHAIEQVPAARVFQPDCRDHAPRFVHLNHHFLGVRACPRLLPKRSEIRVTCAAGSGLLNVAHVVPDQANQLAYPASQENERLVGFLSLCRRGRQSGSGFG